MTNVDLSFGTDVKDFVENDSEEREARVFIYTRPLETAKAEVDGRNIRFLPNRSIFQHWGIWIQFEKCSANENNCRCVYTFDADVISSNSDEPAKTSDGYLDRLFQFAQFGKTMMAGQFIVRVFGCSEPSQHPANNFIKKPDEKYDLVGRIAPSKLLEIARDCAKQYRTYNLIFNNCQEFANDLWKMIGNSMKDKEGKTPKVSWTIGDVVKTVAGAIVVAGGIAVSLGPADRDELPKKPSLEEGSITKIVKDRKDENEEKDDDVQVTDMAINEIQTPA